MLFNNFLLKFKSESFGTGNYNESH